LSFFDNSTALIRGRKGTWDLWPFHIKDHEQREVPIPQHTISILTEWLGERPEGSPLILVTLERYRRVLKRWRLHQKKGLPWLTDFEANNLVRDLRVHATRAGIKNAEKLTIHTLRKSCATNWAAHLPMHAVRHLMGR